MGQKKLIRFAELPTLPNVLQFPGHIKGNWKHHFKNTLPITLELACGKGEYALGLATLHPENNYIGIDIKGNRLWVGAKQALKKQIENVAFLRIQIDQITEYFDQNEVGEIWITFPDPQLRFSKMKKRLTHPKFLRKYQRILKPGGLIHLKTDSPSLYHFTKTVIEMYNCRLVQDIDHLYGEKDLDEQLKIQTHYEKLDIANSNRIHYLCFSLPSELPTEEKDHELKLFFKDAPETIS